MTVVQKIKDTCKARLTIALDALTKAKITKLRRGDNLDPYLSEIWLYQEIYKWAKKRKEAAWEIAQDKDGVLPQDDELRALGLGDHIVKDSHNYSVTINVANGQPSFDKDAFLLLVSNKHGVPLETLQQLAESCVSVGKLKLTKRVLEA